MNRVLLISVLLFGNIVFVYAQKLLPEASKPLIEHLLEVNKEWTSFETKADLSNQPTQFDNDEARIQLHLKSVVQLLKSADNNHLTNNQLSTRQALIKSLETYYQAAIFPQNHHFHHRHPIFKDQDERSCAVAFLMENTGHTDLVKEIQADANFSYLKELVIHYPEINTWAETSGFTINELALIQPGYSPPPQQWNQWGNGGGVDGHVNVMKKNDDGTLLFLGGDFTNVDGIEANSIIAWDGESWHTLGNGVTGEILDMQYEFGKLFIVGDFMLNDDLEWRNIAFWENNTWVGLQKGDMNGSVKTIHVGNEIMVGGDFEMIDGQAISYLAKRQYFQFQYHDWNNYVTKYVSGMNYDTIYNAFAVDAPVNVIRPVENRVLVAGEFTQTAPEVTSTLVQQINTQFMSYWAYNDWDISFTGPYHEVTSLEYLYGQLYVGSNNPDPLLCVLKAGFWTEQQMNVLDTTAVNQKIEGYTVRNGVVFAYGNLAPFDQFNGVYNSGFIDVNTNNASSHNVTQEGTVFDKTVSASVVFQDYVYFAGDFTWAGFESNTFNGLTYSPYEFITPTINVSQNDKFDIYCSNKKLFINYEMLNQKVTLNLFNLQGQLQDSFILAEGSNRLEEDISNLSNSIYVYQIDDGRTQVSGKIAVY